MAVKDEEQRILEFWAKRKIYEKAKALRKKAKKFYFLDGPPYATGYIHVGTAMNKILKDFYIRFFRMFGLNVWDQPGYDTHGLPIENKVEKKLNFRSKADIEKFGIENFNNECRKFATEFIDVMNSQFSNLGVWMDWNNPYLTMSNEYIEGAWFTFKKGFEKGLLYKDNYSVHVCPHCETAVAYNEIEYTQKTDPSIYVKFPLHGKEKEFLLIWTTTPWTIPSNMGIMAKPDAEYVKVRIDDEVLIMAKQLLEVVMKKVGKSYEIVATMKGKDLGGMRYDHPLKEIFPFLENVKSAHRVVMSSQFVTMEDGTGLVHTAPGHGQEDYKVGIEAGLPVVSPLKMNGRFDENSGKYAGIFAKDADPLITQDLKEKNAIFYEEKITHEYPLCWRCDSPLLMMAVPQWFFRVTKIRDKMIEENKKINWTPAWAGQRFRNWLESLGDWPISRQRYWGIPLPIWACEKCDNIVVVGSMKDLKKKLKDLHRPYIDSVTLKCKKCKGVMRRIPDVLDVWFDSGCSSWAPLGYPKNKKLFRKLWPVDFVLEGPDQIRGWWNSSMINTIIAFNRKPYNNILFHGFVMDAHGNKMAKSRGNIVNPEEVVEKYGRDVLRFYFLSGAPWEDYFFKWEDMDEINKSFVVVRNTFNFVKTYVTNAGKKKNLKKEDRWILSKLSRLVDDCTAANRTFNAQKSSKYLLGFVLNDLSRWYVKIIRERVKPSYDGKDKAAAFFTLHTVTKTLSQLLAPHCPFLAEQIHQDIVLKLGKDKESVHMCDWPKLGWKVTDRKLEEDMKTARKIVETCHMLRQKAGIKLKWPVKNVYLVVGSKEARKVVKTMKEILLQMCNCKAVAVAKDFPAGELAKANFELGKIAIERKLDSELMEEAMVRELVREIQSMRKKNGFNVMEAITLGLDSDAETNNILKKYEKNLKKEVGAKKIFVGKVAGKYKGSLQFEDKEIEIAFDRC